MTNHQLQTVLDALTLLGSYANLPRDASIQEAKAIAIVKQMMQAEPVAWWITNKKTDEKFVSTRPGDWNNVNWDKTPLYPHTAPQAEPVAWRSRLASGSYTYCNTPEYFDNAEPIYASPVAPQAVPAMPAVCEWTQDADFEMGDTYHSSCGELWSFIDGGPKENRVSYCHHCGKPVKLASAPKGTV